jgi:hypothetical protein
VFRCSSFRLHDGVAYQCALNLHLDEPEHIAFTRTAPADTATGGEQWGLLVWTSDMAYRGYGA